MSSLLATSWLRTNMFKAYLFWETEKIKILFSILSASEVISPSLSFPRFSDRIHSLSSLYHHPCALEPGQAAWWPLQLAETLAVKIINTQGKTNSGVYSAWPVSRISFILMVMHLLMFSMQLALSYALDKRGSALLALTARRDLILVSVGNAVRKGCAVGMATIRPDLRGREGFFWWH